MRLSRRQKFEKVWGPIAVVQFARDDLRLGSLRFVPLDALSVLGPQVEVVLLGFSHEVRTDDADVGPGLAGH